MKRRDAVLLLVALFASGGVMLLLSYLATRELIQFLEAL